MTSSSKVITLSRAAKAEHVTIKGTHGFFMRGSQTVSRSLTETVTYRKFAIVLGGATETALVTVQAPDGDKDVSDTQLEAALRTIVFRAKP